MSVHQFPGASRGVASSGEPPDNSAMEARLAKVEAVVETVQRDIAEIKADIREIRRDARGDFRLLFGSIITLGLGMAGLMAKGFHWL